MLRRRGGSDGSRVLFPRRSVYFWALAEEAARSRLHAGLQFQSDYFAGLDLGRRVGEKVIEMAKADGSDAVWTGTVPTGTCMWTGTNPGNVTMPGWTPILLASASEFRSPPPPGCQTAEARADADAVLQYSRTFVSNYKAFFWQSPQGLLPVGLLCK